MSGVDFSWKLRLILHVSKPFKSQSGSRSSTAEAMFHLWHLPPPECDSNRILAVSLKEKSKTYPALTPPSSSSQLNTQSHSPTLQSSHHCMTVTGNALLRRVVTCTKSSIAFRKSSSKAIISSIYQTRIHGLHRFNRLHLCPICSS